MRYQVAPLAKLAEEAREEQEAPAEQPPDELADILEVIQALTAAVGMSWAQLLALAAQKRTQHGGFEKWIFLETRGGGERAVGGLVRQKLVLHRCVGHLTKAGVLYAA